jgi:hypothetical protein
MTSRVPSGPTADSTAARKTFAGSYSGVSLLITTVLTTKPADVARWPRCVSKWLLPCPKPAPSSIEARPPPGPLRGPAPSPSSSANRSSISLWPEPRAMTASAFGTPLRSASTARRWASRSWRSPSHCVSGLWYSGFTARPPGGHRDGSGTRTGWYGGDPSPRRQHAAAERHTRAVRASRR